MKTNILRVRFIIQAGHFTLRNRLPYSEQFTDCALGPLVAALGPHCHDLGPMFHTKLLNNLNFILTELSGAHCKHPKQVQEQSERWKNVVARSFVATLPQLFEIKILAGFK